METPRVLNPKSPGVRKGIKEVEEFLYGPLIPWTDKDDHDAFFEAAEWRDSRNSIDRRTREG